MARKMLGAVQGHIVTAKGDAARHLDLALAHFRHAVLAVRRIDYLPLVGLDIPLVGLDLPLILAWA